MSMFNNNRNSRDPGVTLPPAPAAQASGGKRGMFSVLGPDVTIVGNVTATADLHIDGRIDGDVNCGSIVQGTDSRINGSVKADIARLAGAIEGSVSVRQLTIERAARITGDVEYETIAIENGASIDGRLKHIAADAGTRNFERNAPMAPAPDIIVVSSSGEAA
ncbi:MAG: polymer-forming cytoskeletal protein [Candidatus Sphingomonas phytovorans]|nr:polymer-forming cytoskeletal protein [Sphingomonas sp.]WEK02375.1 MAG: polymer-forming cytoskeletal protein [Sphingomonas sp.]